MQNSPARSPIDVGSVIADTYTIEALIGRGGMGAVFRASHTRLPGKHVAIKMLHADLSSDEVLARFKQEAKIAAKLGHPNICAVHDFNVLPDGTPYLVLDYLEGESLAQRLKAGPLPLEQALSIVRQVGSALAAAHREGIVHRDLKPQNIFLVPSEVDGRQIEIAKVLDFGISKIRGSDTVKTQDSTLLGTPQYMAPEQATGQHSAIDERTDVFALGAIVYEMLAGHPAFSGASIPEVVFKVVYEQPVPLVQEVPSLPAAIAAAVNQAMSKAAGDRYSTVSHFVEALTGQGLTSVNRVAAPRPVSGSDHTSVPPSKSTGKDAFAQTMGSGDHGESPVGAVRGSTPTVDSISVPAPADESSTELPPARRSWALIVALVLGAAALAAGAMYFLMRDRPAEEPERHHERVAEQPAPPVPPKLVIPPKPMPSPRKVVPSVVPVAPPDAKQPDATPAQPVLKTPEPATNPDKKSVAAATPHVPVTEHENADADETSAQKLQEAESALSRKEFTRAEQLANAVIAGEHSGRNQIAHAHVIHGTVECTAHHSEENARIDLRQLDGFPKLRKRLISACQDEGALTSVSE